MTFTVTTLTIYVSGIIYSLWKLLAMNRDKLIVGMSKKILEIEFEDYNSTVKVLEPTYSSF